MRHQLDRSLQGSLHAWRPDYTEVSDYPKSHSKRFLSFESKKQEKKQTTGLSLSVDHDPPLIYTRPRLRKRALRRDRGKNLLRRDRYCSRKLVQFINYFTSINWLVRYSVLFCLWRTDDLLCTVFCWEKRITLRCGHLKVKRSVLWVLLNFLRTMRKVFQLSTVYLRLK